MCMVFRAGGCGIFCFDRSGRWPVGTERRPQFEPGQQPRKPAHLAHECPRLRIDVSVDVGHELERLAEKPENLAGEAVSRLHPGAEHQPDPAAEPTQGNE